MSPFLNLVLYKSKSQSPKLISHCLQIQTINGVVLVSWRQRVLERQIEYGARLGHVVLSLARMELKNFYKNVMPVADYFDQSNMLIAVSINFIFLIKKSIDLCRHLVSNNGINSFSEMLLEFKQEAMYNTFYICI